MLTWCLFVHSSSFPLGAQRVNVYSGLGLPPSRLEPPTLNMCTVKLQSTHAIPGGPTGSLARASPPCLTCQETHHHHLYPCSPSTSLRPPAPLSSAPPNYYYRIYKGLRVDQKMAVTWIGGWVSAAVNGAVWPGDRTRRRQRLSDVGRLTMETPSVKHPSARRSNVTSPSQHLFGNDTRQRFNKERPAVKFWLLQTLMYYFRILDGRKEKQKSWEGTNQESIICGTIADSGIPSNS